MVTLLKKPQIDDGITDRCNNEADQHGRAAARLEDDATAQTVLSMTHALAERLTAEAMYFASVRRNISNCDHKAAEKLIQRMLEQSDQVQKIAELLRASLRERLP